MAYLTELHCHTGEISNCGEIPADEIVERYIAAGYTSLTITNHLSHFTFEDGKKHKYKGDGKWDSKIDFFMSGIRLAEKAANGRLNILWGVELRSNTDDNDYLIYNITESFLRENPDLLDITVRSLSERLHNNGMMLFQAHPFRDTIRVTKPSYLDGIETYNGHPGHDSRNDIALMWARKYNLKMLSGTDLHHFRHSPVGGILTHEPVVTNEQLDSILRSGNYAVLNSGREPDNKEY